MATILKLRNKKNRITTEPRKQNNKENKITTAPRKQNAETGVARTEA